MKPLPAPVVPVATVFAPKIKSVGLLVLAFALVLVALVPLPADVTSTGSFRLAPAYSRTRTSGYDAATEKVTITLFAPAAAAAMLLA